MRVWLVALAAVAAGCSRKAPEPAPTAAVDARQCSGCHAAHAKTFHQTGMGRSFDPATPANMVENFDRGASFYHKPSDRYYRVSRRGDQFFLRRVDMRAPGAVASLTIDRAGYFVHRPR